eukprot:CAMPEP_0194550902 /NCGR_PEP_ID=MMETSP0253-20130528/95951_1 /TAXON_ID=2966 /ORGANISM="Noctiluca scintillans" /LENGTH=90 /DNA_ID=CAMNT_0039398353 /DNA_START=589 /DNA_END=858 /DNA_ORIENTATION=-
MNGVDGISNTAAQRLGVSRRLRPHHVRRECASTAIIHRIARDPGHQDTTPSTADASRALSAKAPGQLNVLGHDGHPLRMDGAQVGVLEET